MKKIALALFAVALFTAPAIFAQDHGEFGVYADYVRLHHANDANFLGVGGRVGLNVHHNVQLEAEMAYDFEREFTNTTSTGGTITTTRSGLRLLHGMFGPKIQTGGGAFRAFVFAKGGFLNFGVSNAGAVSGFNGQVGNVLTGDTNGVFYPGGGVEVFAGPIGLRVDAGDLMYFDRGANHNLRITFGPQFRF